MARVPLDPRQAPSPLLRELAFRIEALAKDVVESDTAKTPSGTPHRTICNGFLKEEGAPRSLPNTMERMCQDSFGTAASLRLAIDGPVRLSWRAKPFDEKEGLWMRLCFEAV